MAELNLKQIIDRLNMEFTGDTRKLVFWYDDNGEFVEDMKDIEMIMQQLLVEKVEFIIIICRIIGQKVLYLSQLFI